MDMFGSFCGILLTIILCSFIELPAILLIVLGIAIVYTLLAACLIPGEYNNLREASGEMHNETSEDSIRYKNFFSNVVSCSALIFYILFTILTNFPIAIGALVLTEVGYSEAMVGLITGISMITSVIFILLIKSKIRQLKPYNIKLYAMILLCISYFVIIWLNKYTAFIFSVGIGITSGLVHITAMPDVIAGTEKMLLIRNRQAGNNDD